MENSIRRRAITRKAPTPQATDRISVILGTAGTWPARTWRSGSEMVTINPRRNANATITGRFRLLVRQVPMRSPMGVMDISAPRVRNIMPTRISTAPMRKHRRTLGEMGAMVKQRSRTMPMMGNTAWAASFHFSFNFFLIPDCSLNVFFPFLRIRSVL